jgi:hypothetical protein
MWGPAHVDKQNPFCLVYEGTYTQCASLCEKSKIKNKKEGVRCTRRVRKKKKRKMICLTTSVKDRRFVRSSILMQF